MWKSKKLLIFIGVLAVLVLLVVGLVLYFTLWHNNSDPASKPGLKLVIDHDGGADDAIAITMSLLYEKYFYGPQVVAITTCFGNVNESQVVINSARILDLCDRSDIPIYSGAKHTLISGIESDYFFGKNGLGDDGYIHPEPVKVQNVHAAIELIELSKKYKGELIILSIGPSTNIALAIRMDPDFVDRLAQLYIGAGHVFSEAKPNPEFNVEMDPEAYYIVADGARPDKVTFVPFSQISASLILEKEWRLNVFGVIDTPIVKALNGYERLSLAATDFWGLLDPAVAAIVLDQTIVKEYKSSLNGVYLCGEKRGINTNNFTSTEPNSRVLYSAYKEKYRQFLLDVYTAELK